MYLWKDILECCIELRTVKPYSLVVSKFSLNWDQGKMMLYAHIIRGCKWQNAWIITCWQKANIIVQINQEKNVYVNSPKWEFYLVTNHILYSLLNFCWKGTPSLSLKQRTARVPHMCKDLMTPTTRWMQLARSASSPYVHSMRQKTIFSGLYEPPPIMPPVVKCTNRFFVLWRHVFADQSSCGFSWHVFLHNTPTYSDKHAQLFFLKTKSYDLIFRWINCNKLHTCIWNKFIFLSSRLETRMSQIFLCRKKIQSQITYAVCELLF